jgi:hypothetical protein
MSSEADGGPACQLHVDLLASELSPGAPRGGRNTADARGPGSREPRPSGRIDHYVLGFGQDLSGEVYVLVSESTGPTGNTGKVFKLVRPSG